MYSVENGLAIMRHRRRVGADDCHYSEGLMSGARLLEMVTDASGELSIHFDSEGGLLAAVKEATFLLPVFAGESLEIVVTQVRVGTRSREKAFEVYKHVRKRLDKGRTAAESLNPPELVAKGTLITVVGKQP